MKTTKIIHFPQISTFKLLALHTSRIVEYKVGQSENVNKKKLEGYGLLPMVSKTAKIFVGQITFYS